MSATHEVLLQRINQNVLTSAAAFRDVQEVGPFRCFISPTSSLIYHNYAVPVRPADDCQASLLELCAVFLARQRIPRFEYLEGLWPDLAGQLELAGFKMEIAAPLMVITPEQLRERSSSSAEVQLLKSCDSVCDFSDHFLAGAEGFEMPLPEPVEVSMQRILPCLETGEILAALARVDGKRAGSGTLVRGSDIGELAGVATIPAFRRQGIAAHLCSVLLRSGFDSGLAMAWLSAAEAGAVRLYHELGFALAGTQMHWSIPATPSVLDTA